MKRLLIGLGIVFGIGVVCSAAGGITYLVDNTTFDEVTKPHYEMKTYDATGEVKQIDIINASSTFELYPSENGDIHFDYPVNKNVDYECSLNDGNLVIKEKTNFHFSFIFFNKPAAKLYIPTSIEKDLSITNLSGSFSSYLETFSAENISLTNHSGSLKFDNIHVQENLDIDNSSGKTNINNAEANQIKLHCSSGSANYTNLKSNQLSVENVSGETNINQSSCDNLISKCTSGTVKYNDFTTNQIDSALTSGLVNFTLIDKEEAYNYDLSVTSGSIKINSTNYNSNIHFGTGEKIIKIKVTSGTTRVTFKN